MSTPSSLAAPTATPALTVATVVVEWQGERLRLQHDRYRSTDGIALLAVEAATGAPADHLTVNPPAPERLDADEVAFRAYGRHEGLVDALVAAGVVAPPHREIPLGMVSGVVCRLALPLE